jgi:hypothetical protein
MKTLYIKRKRLRALAMVLAALGAAMVVAGFILSPVVEVFWPG